MVTFEWDEAKRLINLDKHEIDFLRMRLIFDGRPIVTATSVRSDEVRNVSTGVIDDRFYTVIWVWRGESVRLISARRSRDGEKRTYRALHDG